MYRFWSRKAISGMAGRRDSTVISSDWLYPTSGSPQVTGKGATNKQTKTPVPQDQPSGRREGFFLLHVVYLCICPYIHPRKSLWCSVMPMTTLVRVPFMEAPKSPHDVEKDHFPNKGLR